MKNKQILIVFILLLSILKISAQSRWSVGVQGTYSSFTLSFPKNDFLRSGKNPPCRRMSGGIIFRARLTSSLSIQIEGNQHSVYGRSEDIIYEPNLVNQNIGGRSFTETIWNHWDIPISLHYAFGKGKFQPFATVGIFSTLSTSLQTSLTYVGKAPVDPDYRPESSFAITAKKKDFDSSIGIIGGIGLAYHLSKHNTIQVQTRLSAVEKVFTGYIAVDYSTLYSKGVENSIGYFYTF